MVVLVISCNELILRMSLIKMLWRIGPSIDHWGTPYKLDFASVLEYINACIIAILTVIYQKKILLSNVVVNIINKLKIKY